MRKRLWSPDEDEKLQRYVSQHGFGNWSEVAKKTGLQRCGKSCRLRWINYLRPDLKRGKLSPEEKMIIINLQKVFGNSWSKIAAHLPGRTDSDIKNFWHSHFRKMKPRQAAAAAAMAMQSMLHDIKNVNTFNPANPNPNPNQSFHSFHINPIISNPNSYPDPSPNRNIHSIFHLNPNSSLHPFSPNPNPNPNPRPFHLFAPSINANTTGTLPPASSNRNAINFRMQLMNGSVHNHTCNRTNSSNATTNHTINGYNTKPDAKNSATHSDDEDLHHNDNDDEDDDDGDGDDDDDDNTTTAITNSVAPATNHPPRIINSHVSVTSTCIQDSNYGSSKRLLTPNYPPLANPSTNQTINHHLNGIISNHSWLNGHDTAPNHPPPGLMMIKPLNNMISDSLTAAAAAATISSHDDDNVRIYGDPMTMTAMHDDGQDHMTYNNNSSHSNNSPDDDDDEEEEEDHNILSSVLPPDGLELVVWSCVNKGPPNLAMAAAAETAETVSPYNIIYNHVDEYHDHHLDHDHDPHHHDIDHDHDPHHHHDINHDQDPHHHHDIDHDHDPHHHHDIDHDHDHDPHHHHDIDHDHHHNHHYDHHHDPHHHHHDIDHDPHHHHGIDHDHDHHHHMMIMMNMSPTTTTCTNSLGDADDNVLDGDDQHLAELLDQYHHHHHHHNHNHNHNHNHHGHNMSSDDHDDHHRDFIMMDAAAHLMMENPPKPSLPQATSPFSTISSHHHDGVTSMMVSIPMITTPSRC